MKIRNRIFLCMLAVILALQIPLSSYAAAENDTAIVYGEKRDYIICVFSETNNTARARACITQISRIIYKGLN